MISADERKKLKTRVRRGDWTVAAEIYRQETGKTITPRNLSHFLTKDGEIPSTFIHDPREKYRAILGAVLRRERTAKQITDEARKMRVAMIGK